MLGTAVTLYEHGVQTATRAAADGAGDDWVVAALLHDIGEMHCPANHGEVPAAILRPFLHPEVTWVLDHHEAGGVFRTSTRPTMNLLLPPRASL